MIEAEEHITYLTGAGASYNSMPTVDELNKDLKKWANHATEPGAESLAYKNRHLNEFPSKNIEFIKSCVLQTSKEVDEFATIDTLARFYKLRKKHNQLHQLKKTVDGYFSLRQFVDPSLKISVDRVRTKADGSTYYVPKANYDYRYDSLFASILDDDCGLANNVSFLTWNYDLELERSLAKFTTNRIHDFAKHIYHINGHSLYPSERFQNSPVGWIDYLTSQGGTEIKYAWETSESSKNEITHRLSKTTHIVVIGYSFPVFNREIDREILKATNLKKIYIQDKKEALPGIKNRVEALLGERANYKLRDNANELARKGASIDSAIALRILNLVDIELVNSVDQFHIPYELK